MFSGLRTNSIFYVLDKNSEPKLQIGQVVSVSNPQPKFPTYQPGQFSPQPMESVVDIRVKLPDGEMEFKQLPSNGQIANSGSLVVSESREAMSAEVDASAVASDSRQRRLSSLCGHFLRDHAFPAQSSDCQGEGTGTEDNPARNQDVRY